MQTKKRLYSNNCTASHCKHIHMNRDRGYYLVEALVCSLIVGILSATLFDGYAKLQSMSVTSQTQLQAVSIGQECIDQLRAQQFSFLQANLGTHFITVVGAANTGDVIFPRPLLRDTQSLTYYSTPLADDSQNYLKVNNNQAVVDLQAGANNTILATITIQWNDGTGPHTYSVNTTLAAAGLNG